MIPLKLETLLAGRVVEQDRVEYKTGWNPNDVIQTVCAFANDLNSVNGGYIVLGIEANNGRPVLPPIGIDENRLDEIQQKLFEYCNQIEPRYVPVVEIVQHGDKSLVYIWCSGGDSGPYKAPVDVLAKKGNKRFEHWIKPMSVVTAAKQTELFDLFSKFSRVTLDERICQDASVGDINERWVNEFLSDSDSSLKSQMATMSLKDKLLSLQAAVETDAGLAIRNIGMLMFCDEPQRFLRYAQVELIQFHSIEAEGSDDFTEKYFYGPAQNQVREALRYINSIMITQKVVKHSDRPEATRFYDYPFEAIEEALVNAVLHKSYAVTEPVEIRIYLDRVIIINYPGPEHGINMEKLALGQEKARSYRNPRLGEFLKEIDLSEKKSTGIGKIIRALKSNGSPPPEFETNELRSYMMTTIRKHPDFDTEAVGEGDLSLTDKADGASVSGKPAITGDKAAISGDKPRNYERLIADYLKQNETATSSTIGELIQLKPSRTREILGEMVKAGVLEHRGEKRGSYYVLASDGQER